jgi:Ser/Thr protein kinase RdoA (MazF antagonist)
MDVVLERMYQRAGVDTLPAHLEQTYGFTVAKVTRLDVGVFRVDRADKQAPLVVRLFSAQRPAGAAEADLAVLRYLAEVSFPAERPFEDNPLTAHEGQAVLVTEFVKEAPKAKRPAYPIVRLGALIGRLHGLPVPAGADRPAGALHHFAEGTLTDELKAAAGWLDEAEDESFEPIRAALADADGGDGLPGAFVHPDPVPKNAIFTATGPVLVDWTSAGRGPRLASLALVLRSSWAAKPFLKGYARYVELTDEERERLAGILFSRQLIDHAFRLCRGPGKTAPKKTEPKKTVRKLRRDAEAQACDLFSPPERAT